MIIDLLSNGRIKQNKMKKTICVLLTFLTIVSCIAGTVEASARASGKFNITVAAGDKMVAMNGFPMGAGERVTINATYYPFDADVDFGIADKNGGFYYIEGENGSASGSIEVVVNGTYLLVVRNNSDVEIEVTGFVTY